jgi:hypothetical protein
MLKLLLRHAPSLLLLSSCSAYIPILQPTPTLTGARQVEVAASASLNNALTGSITYSPLAHVLVQGDGSVGFTTHDTPDAIHRQGELALGFYSQPKPEGVNWLALAGYGQAYSRRTFLDVEFSPWLPFPIPAGLSTYRATYRRSFAQLMAYRSVADQRFVYGLSARAVRTDFSHSSINGMAFTHAPVYYIEPLFFARFSIGNVKGLQAQAQMGTAVALLNRDSPLAARRLYRGNLFINAGLVFQPAFLWKREAVAAPN